MCIFLAVKNVNSKELKKYFTCFFVVLSYFIYVGYRKRRQMWNIGMLRKKLLKLFVQMHKRWYL